MKKRAIILLTVLFLSCKSTSESPNVLKEREELRNERSYIQEEWSPAEEGIYSYFERCITGVPGADIYPIWFRSLDDVMNGLVFTPEISNGKSVLLIHGYAGNIRGLYKIISHLVKSGYTVAALTLPGHSLSGGKRGDIDDFNDYGEVVHDFLVQLEGKIPKIDYAIGHSTGCTSLIIYNEKYDWNFNGVVFIAPLIRSYSWYSAVAARFLSSPFIKSIDTRWSGPFAVQTFPFHWFDELKDWNKRVKKYKKQTDELIIFQGKMDRVVSWRYNLKFIKKLYKYTEINLYKNADHVSIFNDEPYISKMLMKLDSFIGVENEFANKKD